MVGSPDRRRLGSACMLALAGSLACLGATVPVPMSLAEVNRRVAPNFTPVHVNERVTVRGVVSAVAYHFPQYSILAIQDEHGATAIKTLIPDNRLDAFHPGDEIEAQGAISFYVGTVSILPEVITVVARKAPPAPLGITPADLQDLKYQ